MLIRERAVGDVAELRRRAGGERRSEQKDALMAMALAVEGMQTAELQRALGRSRGLVQRWAYACRDGEVDAVINKRRVGRLAKLRGENLVRLKALHRRRPDSARQGLHAAWQGHPADRQGRAEHRRVAVERLPHAGADEVLLAGAAPTPREAEPRGSGEVQT